MYDEFTKKAIANALEGKWKEALEINKTILESYPEDTDTLNRLSRAYSELGNISKAKSTAKQTLKLDPFNSIALKSLEKWKKLKKGETFTSKPSNVQVYLEEPGKTKIITLLHLGSDKVLAALDSGDEVKLNTSSHRVSITTNDGKYIGRTPDDLSARLKKLTKYGNEYKVFIKSIDKKEVRVFIKEVKRASNLSNVASFPTEKIDYVSFTPPELIHKKEEVNFEESDDN